jgi:hypothetical protein
VNEIRERAQNTYAVGGEGGIQGFVTNLRNLYGFCVMKGEVGGGIGG